MKTAVVVLSLALVFLALLEVSVAFPGEKEVKGKSSKSASDIENSASSATSERKKIGGLSVEQETQKSAYNQDKDTASASETEETVRDDFGNVCKSKTKSKKTGSVDVDSESSSTYSKVSY